MDLLSSTSIVAAFIAGIAALFAPCCITVLLPSYLGSVFKERYKVVLMTFIFFLGILTVFLPIGLGASALAQVFNRYHNLVFTLGGLMLSGLGIALLIGMDMSLPAFIKPSVKKYSVLSVYMLGIFSAIATTCCAPVLAGVLALSVTSGSILWGGVYTLSYVLGMVTPLFLIAFYLDKINFTQKFVSLRKPRTLKIKDFTWRFNLASAVAGFVFLGVGIYIIYLALVNRLAMQSNYQLSTNIIVANIVSSIRGFTQKVPESVWAGIVLLIFVMLIIYAIKQFKKHD
ncbi:MAG: cytochrome c biogenesis protein CcdA [Patescibacteria group bacterium]